MRQSVAIVAALLGLAGLTGLCAEEVEVAGPQGPLAGTYLAPTGQQPMVLILPGSGPTDRDGNNPLGVHAAPYRLLAEALQTKGIGSLRADKRGLFASRAAIADANAVTIADYVTDASSWVHFSRRITGRDCVWLLGHSEGGIIAISAAGKIDGICGLILIATPGRPTGVLLREQLSANPANAPVLPEAMAAIAKLEAGERVDTGTMHPGLQGLFASQVQGFMVDLMAHDPAALVAGTHLPIVVIQGGKDIQVSQADADALAAANPAVKLVVLANMNHVLKDVEGDSRQANIASYADADRPLASGLVDALIAFLEQAQ